VTGVALAVVSEVYVVIHSRLRPRLARGLLLLRLEMLLLKAVMYVVEYLLSEVRLVAAQLQVRAQHLMVLVVQGRRPESLLE
jgi:hypothetical protein